MLTLYIYKPAQIDGCPDDFITSFSAETNRECEDEAFEYLGDDDYYATYTEQS